MSAPDPFGVVHRARRRRTFGLTLTGALAASAFVAVVWLVPAVAAPVSVTTGVETQPAVLAAPAEVAEGAPSSASAPEVPGTADPAPADPAAPRADGGTVAIPAEGGAAPGAPVAAPAPPAPPAAGASAAPAPTPAAPREYSVAIDTAGYQNELDRCLWVRMDLTGATAPIAGAHNNCGGELVLDLSPGDVVTLAGQSLDGRYVVVGSRDGRPGQDAAEATAGLGASVILQTCYVEGPDVRLVALVRVA